MKKERLEKRLLEEKNDLIKKLNKYILTTNIDSKNSQEEKQVKLQNGKIYIGESKEGNDIKKSFSENEILILAYEANQSTYNSYDSKFLEIILNSRKIIKTAGSKEVGMKTLEKQIEKIKETGYKIIERKKGFFERKKEQFKMLKDKETRADGLSLLLGNIYYGDIKKEKVKTKLTRVNQEELIKLYEIQNLFNGETKKFVEEEIKSSILIQEKIQNSGVKTNFKNQNELEKIKE